jgi:CHAD domain-containing protein
LLDHARRSLERTHRKLGKRARRIDWGDAARRHAVRIAVKRLRYGCDFFAACYPQQATRPFLARLAKLQDTLGELNDISVARLLLKELREDAAGVRRWLARRERTLVTSLAKEWAAFERRRPYWRPKPRRRARR